jgi:hypothetical protein
MARLRLLVLFIGLAALDYGGKLRLPALQKQADAGAAQLAKKQARLASVTAEFAPRQKDPAVEPNWRRRRASCRLREVSGVLDAASLGNTQGYAEYFRALARQHVDGLWLTGVSIAGAGVDIGVRGRALDPQRVPGYLNRLTQRTVMRGQAFGSLQIGQGRRAEGVEDGKETSAPAPMSNSACSRRREEGQAMKQQLAGSPPASTR